MTKKVTISYTMGGNAIDAALPMLEKRIAGLVLDVQKIAVSILRDFKTHGDKPTAVRRANALVKALGKGVKGNQMLAWFECNAPLVYNKETKLLVAGFTAASPVKDHAKIDSDGIVTALWYEAAPEAEYKPLDDWNKALMALVKRAKEDIAKMGDKSKVNPQQLATLEMLAAGKSLVPVVPAADPLAD